jgi:DNA primase
MRIPDQILEEISRRVDIVELVGRYVSLRQSGSKYMGLCPFHTEKTPSFSVDPQLGLYYCFGCHQGGGSFKFVMEIEGLSFREAVAQLGEEVGVAVDSEEEDEQSKERRALSELYNRVAGTFHHFLHNSDDGAKAAAYLLGRKLTDQTIEQFNLGFAPSDPFWLHGFLEKKGYSAEFLAKSGLFTRKNPQRSLFAGRLIFPISNARGDVVAFGGRILVGDGPKYINSPETTLYHKRSVLFGLSQAREEIRKSKRVLIAEGYMDVIALHQAGLKNSVAPLGTAFTQEQGDYLVRFADQATLVFDADSAGGRATRRAAEILEAHGVAVSVVELEPGSDPADLLVSGGSQAVVNAVSSPLSILEFLVRQSLQENAASTPAAKQAALEQLYPYIRLMGSDVKRDESLRLAADLLGADRAAVRRDFSRTSTRQTADVRPQEASSQQPTAQKSRQAGLSHDLFLMLATVQNREHFAIVRRTIQPEDLEDGDARELFLALEECYRREETSLDLLMSRITRADVAQLVQQRLSTGEFSEHSDLVIRDGIRAIRERNLLKQRHAIERELRRIAAEGHGGTPQETDLLTEKMVLDQELQKVKGKGE